MMNATGFVCEECGSEIHEVLAIYDRGRIMRLRCVDCEDICTVVLWTDEEGGDSRCL